MNIWILDKNHQTLASLSNDSSLSCPFWTDSQVMKLTDFDSTFTFTAPSDHEEAGFLLEGNFVLAPDPDQDLILYRIVNIDDGLDSSLGVHTKVVTCEDAFIFDLASTICAATTFKNEFGINIMNYILQGTGWRLGRQDYIGNIASFTIDANTSAIAALQNFVRSAATEDTSTSLDETDPTNLVCEPKFHVIYRNGRIVDYVCDIYAQRGEKTGKRFEYTKDVLGVTRHSDLNQVKTALRLVGGADTAGRFTSSDFRDTDGNPTNISVRSVNNGLDYIYDDAANQQYNAGGTGYIMGIATNSDIDNPWALLDWGHKKLAIVNHPHYTYVVDVVLLEQYGFVGEKVRLGDTVKVIDRSMNPYLLIEARIIEIDICFSDPSQSKVVLGDFTTLQMPATPDYVAQIMSMVDAANQKAQQGLDYQLQMLTLDGTDFGDNATQKRLVVKAYLGNKDVTTQMSNSAFAWEKINPDGSHDLQWEIDHSDVGNCITVGYEVKGCIVRCGIDETVSNPVRFASEGDADYYASFTNNPTSDISGDDPNGHIGKYVQMDAVHQCNYWLKRYTGQYATSDGVGSYQIVRTSLDGQTILDSMVCVQGGDCRSFGLQYDNDQQQMYIWASYYTPDYHCNMIVRFPYTPHKVMYYNDASMFTYRPLSGMYSYKVNYDPVSEYLLIATQINGNEITFYVCDTADILAAKWKPLYSMHGRDFQFDYTSQKFQSAYLDYPYVYMVSGNEDGTDMRMWYCVDIRSQSVVYTIDFTFINIEKVDKFATPETAAVVVDGAGYRYLLLGFCYTPAYDDDSENSGNRQDAIYLVTEKINN